MARSAYQSGAGRGSARQLRSPCLGLFACLGIGAVGWPHMTSAGVTGVTLPCSVSPLFFGKPVRTLPHDHGKSATSKRKHVGPLWSRLRTGTPSFNLVLLAKVSHTGYGNVLALRSGTPTSKRVGRNTKGGALIPSV